MLAVLVSLLSIFAPMEQIPSVLKTKQARFIDINIVSMALLNACCWFTFGCLVDDIYIITPNMFGIASNSILIGIRSWAQGQLPQILDFPEVGKGGDGNYGDYLESKKI